MNNLRNKRLRRFKSITNEHIGYMKDLMEDIKTKDKSLDQKVVLMKRKFGENL